ncbi:MULTISPECIES: hypothetical protein [unclassified Bradyrhizobium]
MDIVVLRHRCGGQKPRTLSGIVVGLSQLVADHPVALIVTDEAPDAAAHVRIGEAVEPAPVGFRRDQDLATVVARDCERGDAAGPFQEWAKQSVRGVETIDIDQSLESPFAFEASDRLDPDEDRLEISGHLDGGTAALRRRQLLHQRPIEQDVDAHGADQQGHGDEPNASEH